MPGAADDGQPQRPQREYRPGSSGPADLATGPAAQALIRFRVAHILRGRAGLLRKYYSQDEERVVTSSQ